MRKVAGKKGEETAALYLAQQGYTVVARNYRCRWGEIDIICRRERLLVMVEVRSKSTDRFGLPEESISRDKVWRIRKTALDYLSRHPGMRSLELRFDFIAVTFASSETRINHIEGAF